MVAGLVKGLSHTDAGRFSFLLATPVILVGSALSGVGAYLSVRSLTGWFETLSLRPFGVYCIVAGVGCLLWFWLRQIWLR